MLDEREHTFFSPLAAFSESALRRCPDKPIDQGYRQAYSVDADRILNSNAYTRYIDKTQVFSLIKNDHLTHRVLHVQLVSKIARTIGRYLGLNEDLIEAAAMGHDIGHPPFGHDGERILSRLTLDHGAGYFHHNVQSIQFLEKIERHGKGWNLALQTLDAILCHNGEVHFQKIKPERSRTFETFDLMLEEMKTGKKKDFTPMTMEGCVVRLSDTIAFIGRDIEDAARLELIKRSDIPEVCAENLGTTNGTIVYNLVTDIIENSLRKPYISFSREISSALKLLREFNYNYIYINPAIKKHIKAVEDIYVYLFHKYVDDLKQENLDSDIFTGFLNGLPTGYRDNHSHPEIARDFISGMTDSFFLSRSPESMRPEPYSITRMT